MKAETPVFIGLVQNGDVLLDFQKQYDAYVTTFEGDEIELEIRRRRTKRSHKANAALHVCLARWCAEKGHDIEQLKDDLLALCWGYIVRQNLFTGEIARSLVKPHTSQLNTAEFTELFDLAAVEAAKEGHVMIMPDEWKRAKEAEAKKSARRRARDQRQPAA